MSTGTINNIKEVKTVDAENYDYLLAQSNFKIQSVFRSRNRAIIEPNVPMIAGFTDVTTAPASVVADPQKIKNGATCSFIIDANDYSLFDLRDAEFDIQAQYFYTDDSQQNNIALPGNKPYFGNQCLLSLFQNITLFIDDVAIDRNIYPGMSSNAEYALRYPHNIKSEKEFEVNGFVRNEKKEVVINTTGIDKIELDNQAISLKVIETQTKGVSASQKALYTGIITQRVKLSDIFSVVNTLPPLYNHKVKITFQRTSNNYIICNTNTISNSLCQCLGLLKFKLFQDVYVTTDQFIQTAKAYYNRPIETLITQDRQYFPPIISQPDGASTQSFNINVDTAYKNKLLTICIPRSTDFSHQYNSSVNYYIDTDDGQATTGTPLLGAAPEVDNTIPMKHYDALGAPANSYTYGGLRYLSVSSTNGLLLYQFDMENDGLINMAKGAFDAKNPIIQNNFGGDNVICANYQDVYRQYLRARLHFQQSEDEGLDFETFMKEYCVFCVDLSCFELSPNENIKVVMCFSSWDQKLTLTDSSSKVYNYEYNPYFEGNEKKNGNYQSTSIICNLFCDKVLRLLPNRRVELADLITTNTVDVDNSNMA